MLAAGDYNCHTGRDVEFAVLFDLHTQKERAMGKVGKVLIKEIREAIPPMLFFVLASVRNR